MNNVENLLVHSPSLYGNEKGEGDSVSSDRAASQEPEAAVEGPARYFLTSVLEYPDRYEGQVFAVGSEDECIRTRDMLSAISISGNEAPLKAWTSVAPIGPKAEALSAGDLWREMKKESA